MQSRRPSQSILKEISPGTSLEGMMLKLKLQYFGHLMQRVDSLEKTLTLEGLGAGEGDDGGWDGWMASLTRWTWVWVNSGIWWWTGRPGMLRFMGSQRVGHDWATELNWTELNLEPWLELSELSQEPHAVMVIGASQSCESFIHHPFSLCPHSTAYEPWPYHRELNCLLANFTL